MVMLHPRRTACVTAKRNRSAGEGLERSCDDRSDWFRGAPPVDGVERLQAWFSGRAYETHRHDTYAIAVTDTGVQSFDYRGGVVNSTVGNVVVVHPDEAHDGRAGTEEGFGYRILYVEPARIGEAARLLAGRPCALPFAAEAVSGNEKLANAVNAAFRHDLEPLAVDGLILQLADGLMDADPSSRQSGAAERLDTAAVERARQFLDVETDRVVRSSELEAITGLTRYDLARQFKSQVGTSPYRYSLMRRLDAARRQIRTKQSLADIAFGAGFADQAHFTRKFKAAFGVTPARYAALQANGARDRRRRSH